MDATGTLDRLGCKVFVMLTNSSSGGLPLGIMITTTESKDAIIKGLEMLQELVGVSSFFGRGNLGPRLFMTDDSDAERGALLKVFPESKLLLCLFHILQSIWRNLWNNNSGVNADDRLTIFYSFKSLVYERNVDIFEKKLEEFMQNKTVISYPNFVDYLREHVLPNKVDWAISYRQNLLTRGQNTNNLSEASMRVSIK